MPATISPLPTPPSRQDPANFTSRADQFLAALPTFATEANNLAAEVNTKATEAANSATDAANSATAAANSATQAANSASAAATSAASAINSPGTSATSTTSLSVSIGSKSLTVQTGKAFVVGQPVMIARTSAPSTTWMHGKITSYNSSTGALVVNAELATGSGTFTDWTISLSGPSIPRRQINGTLFDGSSDITTAKWGTARTITIGNTDKSFDGSTNVSWSLDEIGVPAKNGAGATGTWGISVSGNADTATKLQTARTLTIGNTSKSFDGSANVSWSLDEIGIPPPISVVGPTSVYVTTTVTLTITDFDDFNTYNVTASHGTISRSGATITYTAPGTVPSGGADTITIQRGTGQRTLTIQILPASVLPPTVTVTGAPSDVPKTPLIGTSAFQTVGVSDTHASTTWRVRRVADNSVVWESVNNTVNKTQITVPSGILQTNTQYRFEAIHNGTTLGASEVGFIQAKTKQHFAQIIGLVQVATGGGAGTYQRIDENFNTIANPGAAYFNSHPTYSGIVTQTIDGQAMVKIPKFYFKAGTVPSGTYAGKAYWMISDQPVAGFSVHPAFIGAGGAELDQIWVGKYQASSSDDGKLQSVPGVLPRVIVDFPTARTEAYARNTGGVSGFRLWSAYDLAAIQMLATIELGGLDMQSLIGPGYVDESRVNYVNANNVAQATWRGIVGLWGNVWQMTDGIKRNGGNWWRWQYNVPGNTTTSDFATGYVNTGRRALTASGYPVTFDTTLLSAGIIVPATVDGTASNGSTGDYFWSNTNADDRIAYHGGSLDNGAYAGLFSLYVGDAPSNAVSSVIGARLAKV